jgi:hypothetical protein
MDWLLVVHAVDEEITRPVIPNILVIFAAVVWTMDFK